MVNCTDLEKKATLSARSANPFSPDWHWLGSTRPLCFAESPHCCSFPSTAPVALETVKIMACTKSSSRPSVASSFKPV